MLFQKLRARLGRKPAPSTRPTTRLRLEELEDRLTPTPFAGTYTNAIVQVTPNLAAGTVTETVTATVTNAPTYSPFNNPTVTPVPAGAVTPSGKVLFALNNQQQSAQLDSNGQATATFTMPILAMLSSQELTVDYQGGTYSGGSSFNAPLYMNYDNLLLPATLTFGQLTPQQKVPTYDTTNFTVTALASDNTAQGEADSMGPLVFNYGDPGSIDSVDVFGFSLPGIFAFSLDAYGSEPIP